MTHTESGIRTASTPSDDGSATLVEFADWETFDAVIGRFHSGADLGTPEGFAAAVATWDVADRGVACAFVGCTVSIHGLSYQSSRVDLAAAVWRGLCSAVTDALDAVGEVRIRSDHPGAAELERAVARSRERDAVSPLVREASTPSHSLVERSAS